jgi:hypothetical protein
MSTRAERALASAAKDRRAQVMAGAAAAGAVALAGKAGIARLAGGHGGPSRLPPQAPPGPAKNGVRSENGDASLLSA